MHLFDRMARDSHEAIHLFRDPASEYRCVVAIHDTTLGPATGGTRLQPYSSDLEALEDALRLSRAMTRKAAVAGVRFGGGKAVILAPRARQAAREEGDEPGGERAEEDRPGNAFDASARKRLFRAHGRAVESLGGRFITGPDIGVGPGDLREMGRETSRVAGARDRSPDLSELTALGVFQSIRIATEHALGSYDLSEATVAVQGVGAVGSALCELLAPACQRLVASDVDSARLAPVAEALGVDVVAPEAIYEVEADVFAPCASGGILNASTVDRLRTAVVCGAANNQLAEERLAHRLQRRGVLYAPDFVVNAGALIGGTGEFRGWDRERIERRVRSIGDTLQRVLEVAEQLDITPLEAAMRLASARLRAAG